MGDALRVRQILGNVVSNAVKFTERGSVAVSVSRVATRVTLVVEDSGIGIAEDKREHIFAPFEQADTSPTRAYGGAGLGLSITRRLAQLMGGEVALTSTEGVGTKVTVELHLPVATALPLVAPVVEPPARPLHVLVAEDNPVNQMLASRLLERWGHEVEVVGDGADAVTRAAAGGLDCILMDLNMPLLGGLEAAGRIREHERELGLARLPIIALTASAVVGEHERCLKAGMDDYVAKPIKPEVLQRVLAACVTRAGQAPGAAECQPAGALPRS
jgi:CheY-like chemotaxis protein/anti-sigma regulatory factor (Ser/Thr protein kinase)